MPLRIVLALVAFSQLVLGALTLFLPLQFASWMGLTAPPADNGYLYAMLGARFVAYGMGLGWMARQAEPDLVWVRNMVLIQLIDFAAGAIYVALGVVALSSAAFPMFNAALFAALLWRFSRGRAVRAMAQA